MLLLREGLRFLRRSWRLSLPASIVLTFGMTASAFAIAVFLLFSQPGAPGARIGNFATIAEQSRGGRLRPITWKHFESLRTSLNAQGIGASAYAAPISVPLTVANGLRYVPVSAVSSQFFADFVATLVTGNSVTSAEHSCSAQEDLVISEPLAASLFGTPALAVGRALSLRGVNFRITAVAPAAFHGLFDTPADVWIRAQCLGLVFLGNGNDTQALGPQANALLSDNDLWLDYPAFYALVTAPNAMGANGLLRKLNAAIHDSRSEDNPLSVHVGLTIDPERDERLRRWASLGIFLAACLTVASSLNFAGLLLARVPGQMAEVNLRRAIGAGATRLFAELSVGPLLVIVAAFTSASTLFVLAGGVVARQSPTLGGVFAETQRHARETMAWELLIALLAGFVVAVLPAIRLLKESGAPRLSYTATSSGKTTRLLRTIVAAQVCFSIAVLVVAAMVVNVSQRLFQTDFGFQASHRLAFAISQQEGRQMAQIYRNDGPFPLVEAAEQVRQRVAAMPGVNGVAFALRAPLDISDLPAAVRTDGSAQAANVSFNAVSSNYFACLGIRFLAGRSFDSDSLIGPPANAVVNRSLAKLLWPRGVSGVAGQMIRVSIPATRVTLNLQVTGIVDDTRTADPKTAAQPNVYLPFRGTALAGVFPWYVIADTTEPSTALEKEINKGLAAQMPGMGSVYSYSIQDRLCGVLRSETQKQQFAVAGASAVVLIALIGVYSSLMYFVSTRQREFAIRASCGATPAQIARIILAKAGKDGLAAAAGSFVLWPLLKQLVVGSLGVVAWSPTLASLVTVLGCLAVLAVSALPAFAANRISIAKALKAD